MLNLLQTVTVMLTVALLTTTTLGQDATSPGPAPDEQSIWPWVIAVACIAVVCVAAFKSAKRTHQD